MFDDAGTHSSGPAYWWWAQRWASSRACREPRAAATRPPPTVPADAAVARPFAEVQASRVLVRNRPVRPQPGDLPRHDDRADDLRHRVGRRRHVRPLQQQPVDERHRHHPARRGLPDVEAGVTYRYVVEGTTADGTWYRSDVGTFSVEAVAVATTVDRGPNLATGARIVDASSEFSDDFAAADTGRRRHRHRVGDRRRRRSRLDHHRPGFVRAHPWRRLPDPLDGRRHGDHRHVHARRRRRRSHRPVPCRHRGVTERRRHRRDRRAAPLRRRQLERRQRRSRRDRGLRLSTPPSGHVLDSGLSCWIGGSVNRSRRSGHSPSRYRGRLLSWVRTSSGRSDGAGWLSKRDGAGRSAGFGDQPAPSPVETQSGHPRSRYRAVLLYPWVSGLAAVSSCRLALEGGSCAGVVPRRASSSAKRRLPPLVSRTGPRSGRDRSPTAIWARMVAHSATVHAQMHRCGDCRPETRRRRATGGPVPLQEPTTVNTERSTRHSTHGSVTSPISRTCGDQIGRSRRVPAWR